jgi:hypothetical protein
MGPRIESRAALVVATVALFSALAGTSYAVVSKISGGQLRNRSVAGIKLKRHTVNGADIDLSGFPTVPSASQAAQATSALHADTAISATSVTGSVPAGQIAGTVASASSATNATNAATAMNATNATNATNAGNADGHTFTQIYSSAGAGAAANVVSGFGGLTLNCVGPSGTAGTVAFEIINSSSAAGTFVISAIDSSGSHVNDGAVLPASGSTPTATTFDLPLTTAAQVSFSYKIAAGSSPDIVTGSFGLTLNNGCTVFGNAEAS